MERTLWARRWRVGLVVGVLAVLATGCVTDLTEEFGDLTVTQAVNDRGAFAGYAGEAKRPVRIEPDGTRLDLAAFDGDDVYYGSINNADEISGTVNGQVRYPGPVYPVAWDASGRLIDLRTMIPHAGKPGVQAYVSALNDNGLLVGVMSGADQSTTPATPVPRQLFTVNIRTGLYTAIPPEVGGSNPYAYGVNDAGVIVGTDGSRSRRWTARDGAYVAEELPEDFDVKGINNAGDLAGTLRRGPTTAAVWKAGTPAPVALPVPDLAPDYAGFRVWITDTGIVVMHAFLAPDTAVRCRTVDATPEVFPLSDWRTFYPLDVNAHGAVIGSAVRAADGVRHSVRWT